MRSLKTLFSCLPLLLFLTQSHAQVLVSPSAGKADSSAMLEVRSSTKGLLPPVMSNSHRKAIKNPAPGLIVFDSTRQLFYGYLKNDGWRPFLMGYDTVIISDAISPASVIDNQDGDQLGFAVAIYGNLAVASAPTDDINGQTDQGSFYVFKLENGSWTNTQKL